MKTPLTLRLLPFLGIVALVIFFSSCKHEAMLPPIIPGVSDSICFETEVLPVIQSNCAKSGCHENRMSTYSQIMRDVTPGKPNSSKLYQVITANQSLGNLMPPSSNQPLTNDQITAIQLWIMEGANPTTCSGGACDSINVTFSKTIMPMVITYCKGCHDGSNSSTTLLLTTYDQVVAAQQNKHMMDHVLNQNGYSQMPKSAKLSDCNIAQLNKWISNGLPNN